MKTNTRKTTVIFGFIIVVLYFLYQHENLADSVNKRQIVLHYERHGGIGGWHDELTIFEDNSYMLIGSKGKQGQYSGKLSPDLQERLFSLLENYGNITSKTEAPPNARDYMSTYLELRGIGNKPKDKQVVREVCELAKEAIKIAIRKPDPLNDITIQRPYNFRDSNDYKQLSWSNKKKLEQVHRDMILLWGTLDIYADYNAGKLPKTLDALVPYYLLELPDDPFATRKTAKEQDLNGYISSKKGYGYRYQRGATENRAWCIASVGLDNFPYNASYGNIGLYRCKGEWISGINLPLKRTQGEISKR